MCIVVVCIRAHPLFPIIILNNREEYCSRSCRCEIHGESGLICGVDPKRPSTSSFHPTWFGMNYLTGRWVTLTNINDFSGSGSRGALVSDLLHDTAEETASFVDSGQAGFVSSSHRGYNIVFGSLYQGDQGPQGDITFSLVSSRNIDPHQVDRLGPGIHVIGNDLVGDEYVKSPFLKTRVEEILQENRDVDDPLVLRNALAEAMNSRVSSFFFPSWQSILKFFTWRCCVCCGLPTRRLQPGWRMFCGLAFLGLIFSPLLIILSFLGIIFSPIIVFVVVGTWLLFSFCMGWRNFTEMQNTLIALRAPKFQGYGTIAQTMIICRDTPVNVNGEIGRDVLYSYRDSSGFVRGESEIDVLEWDDIWVDGAAKEIVHGWS